MKKKSILISALLALFIGQACAEDHKNQPKETADQIDDPLEGYNRFMYNVNWGVDKVLFRPLSEFYGLVPSPARKGVRNVLTNLNSPVTFVNDVLQLEIERAGQTFVRTLINSTLGIGGIFDVATNMGLEYHSEDFGQTLEVAGLPSGPYIVLPLLGPSTPRDIVGRVGDTFANPVNWILWHNDLDYLIYTKDGVGMLDRRTEARAFTDELENAPDAYARVRSIYLQSRGNHSEDDNDSPTPTENE